MKKLIVSFLVAILFLSLVSAGITGQRKASTPRIEKVTFVHYEIGSHSSPPVWDDTEDDFRLIANGVKWSDTISYEVNAEGSGLDEEVVLATLEASSETWDSNTTFDLFAAPEANDLSSVGLDGKNRVVWNHLNPGVIALAHLWYIPPTREIVEFDLEFNRYYKWSTAGDSDAMDLQNIATHEFGHNGLSDLRPPKDQELTMYAYSMLGETKKRTLGTGDMLGIKRLYGE